MFSSLAGWALRLLPFGLRLRDKVSALGFHGLRPGAQGFRVVDEEFLRIGFIAAAASIGFVFSLQGFKQRRFRA